jgi:hypothetical protein
MGYGEGLEGVMKKVQKQRDLCVFENRDAGKQGLFARSEQPLSAELGWLFVFRAFFGFFWAE